MILIETTTSARKCLDSTEGNALIQFKSTKYYKLEKPSDKNIHTYFCKVQ